MSSETGIRIPLWRQGYAVFVKLWDLTPDSPADEACALIDSLDEALLTALEGDKHSWFQNPYGASAFFPDVNACLRAIAQLGAAFDPTGALISTGVAWGHFERNYSVSAWNTAAVAVNTAARLASIADVQGRIAVDRKVRDDMSRSSGSNRALFGEEKTGVVKGVEFRYYLLPERYGRSRKRPMRKALQPNASPTTPANIVSFDIEKYSRQPTSEQAKLSTTLFKCVEQSLASVGEGSEHWTPAGDGGQLVFGSEGQNSAPQAWRFAQSLLDLTVEAKLPLRIGVDNGPVLKSKHRAAVGGALLRADQVSNYAKAYGLAVSTDFWAGLPDAFKAGMAVAPSSEDAGVLIGGDDIPTPHLGAPAIGSKDTGAHTRTSSVQTGRKQAIEPPLGAKPPRLPGALPEIWNVPRLKNPNFTGREELLVELSCALKSGRPAALTQAISGLGGVGKTQLAIEYAYRHGGEYSLVWWVRAEDTATAVKDYVDLAPRIGLDGTADATGQSLMAVKDWLSRNAGWLLIFDNAADSSSCEELIPYGATGHVIVTSRNSNWKRIAEPLLVKTLPRQQSVEFLLKRTGLDHADAASALAEEFGDLPLALDQAAAYIEASNISISEYLRLFRRNSKQLLGPVAVTWLLSLERLEHENPDAIGLMNLFAFLAPEEIPRELARKVAGSEYELNDAVAVLRRYSLIEANRYGLTVHRLVQAAVRQRLQVLNQEPEWAGRAVGALYQLRSLAGTARLLSHVLQAAAHCERLGIASETAINLLKSTGAYLRDHGQLTAAGETFGRALRIAERTLGPEHREVSIQADNLAQVFHKRAGRSGSSSAERGRLNEASELTRKALTIETLQSNPSISRVAVLTGNLARILKDLGDLAGARECMYRALDLEEKIYGADHPRIAILADELSSLLYEIGDVPKALLCARRALEIDTRMFGPNHPQVAIDENNIALLYEENLNSAEARAHIRRAVAILRQSYGSEHLITKQAIETLDRIETELTPS